MPQRSHNGFPSVFPGINLDRMFGLDCQLPVIDRAGFAGASDNLNTTIYVILN